MSGPGAAPPRGEHIAALAAYQQQHRNGRSGSVVEPVPDDKLIRRMSDVTSRTIQWAWKGRLALGYITVQTGEEGLGKSVFAAWLAARATRGQLEGDWHGNPVDVLIVAGEDGLEDTWQPRLAVADADLERVAALNLDALSTDWNVRDGIDELRRAVRETGARLIVFDALFDHMPPTSAGENINSPTFVRGALGPMKDLVRELGIVGLISLHPPKARGAAFRDLVQASQAFSAIPRVGLYFGWHPDDADDDPDRRRVLVRGKGNIGRNPGALEFRVTGRNHLHGDGEIQEREVVVDVQECDITLAQLTGRPRGDLDEAHNSKTEKVAGILRARLAGGEWMPCEPIRDGLEAVHLNSPSVVNRAKQMAGVESRQAPGTAHGGWQWRIPQNPTPPIYPPMDSDPSKTPESQQPRSESQNPTPATADSDAGQHPTGEPLPLRCSHDAPKWRLSPAGVWLCDKCYPHPAGTTTIDWQHA